MSNTSQTLNFLNRYTQQFYPLKAVVLSDYQGIFMCGSYKQQGKQNQQKYTRASTMLISALNQTNNNFQKIKSKDKIRKINYYINENLVHIYQKQNLSFTLFFDNKTSALFANQISSDMSNALMTLNHMVPDFKKQ